MFYLGKVLLTPTNNKIKQFLFKEPLIGHKFYHDKQQDSFTKHPAECRQEDVMEQDGHNEAANL